jgi:hypothetical protein
MSEKPSLDLDAPRGLGDLLATTLRLFGRHSGLFLSVTLLVVAPVVIVVDGVWGRGLVDGSHQLPRSAASLLVRNAADFAMPVLVTALHVALVRALGDGRAPGVGEALRTAAPRFLAAGGAVLFYTFITILGLCALIVPGLWIMVGGYFGAQIAVMERAGPFEAVMRSFELVRGRWWKTAGMLLVAWFVLFVTFWPLNMAVRAVHVGVAYITLLTLVKALELSLSALFGTLLYFSLRARKRQPAALVAT